MPGQFYKKQKEIYENKKVLDLKVDNSDFNKDLTIRGYLHLLLTVMWDQKVGFSGKRPFGNSGWEYDLYFPLVKNNIVGGRLDEHGFLEDVDEEKADQIIFKCIDTCFEI